jgi:hypothetical protein
MVVQIVDDINVKVVSDPEHNEQFRGQFLLVPNSVRADVLHHFDMPQYTRGQWRPFKGKDLEK